MISHVNRFRLILMVLGTSALLALFSGDAESQKKEAVAVWERAMKEEPIGKRDKERKLKIEAKLKTAKQ